MFLSLRRAVPWFRSRAAWAVAVCAPLLGLSCGARSGLFEPREIPLSGGGRQVMFVLDYSLTAFAPTLGNRAISSWQSAVSMAEAISAQTDESVLVGGLVFPHPRGWQNQSCRIDSSMLSPPSNGPGAFLGLLRTFVDPAGASATFDALERVDPLVDGNAGPAVVVLYLDGVPICRREFDRSACQCRTSSGDCTSRSPGDPAGLLWGCDDTSRAASAIARFRNRGVAVFVATSHQQEGFRSEFDYASATAMALASGTPGPTAARAYFRTDVPADVDELRSRVVAALTTSPCRFRSSEDIPNVPFRLVFEARTGTQTVVDSERWQIAGARSIEIRDRALCSLPSVQRLRLIERDPDER